MRDPESDSFILMRRRDATPDPEPLEGGVQEEIARGVRGLRFEYYDGYDWFDDWGDPEGKTKGMMYPPANSYGLPEAVRITIVFDPETQARGVARRSPYPGPLPEGEGEKTPMTFQTIARLDLADYFNRQTVSSSNKNSNSGDQTQQTQNRTKDAARRRASETGVAALFWWRCFGAWRCCPWSSWAGCIRAG